VKLDVIAGDLAFVHNLQGHSLVNQLFDKADVVSLNHAFRDCRICIGECGLRSARQLFALNLEREFR